MKLIRAISDNIRIIRMVGVPNVVRSTLFAIQRDLLERRTGSGNLPAKHGLPESPGRLLSAESASGGASFRFAGAHLEVRFLTPDFLRVAWNGSARDLSYAVVEGGFEGTEAGKVSLEPSKGGWSLRTGSLELLVGDDGGLRLLDARGKLVRHDQAPHRLGDGWNQRAWLDSESAVYGLGERANGLNLNPGTYRMWNTEISGSYGPGRDPLYTTMPIYLCLDGRGSHLVFYDNTYDGRVTFDRSGAEISFDDGPLRYYLAVGSPAETLERFTQLAGRAPLPPRWALGFHQCRWGYQTEAEMRRVFEGFQSRNLPLSVLYMDGDHMEQYKTFTIDEERYPDVPGLARDLAEAGVHLVASVNPGIKKDQKTRLYDEARRADVFCKAPDGGESSAVVWPGWVAHTDYTNPRVREWWGSRYASYLESGIEGFWHDMNEPSSFATWGDQTLPLTTRHDMEGRGGDHREAHNVYGLLMNRSGHEGLRRLRPEKRPFVLSRSGWVGMQRHAWNWTGDIESSWNVLRQTIGTVLGLGLSGVPYSGPDIGGFSGQPSTEMFVRWFQLGSFLPFFRVHSAYYLPPREPWEWDDEVLGILREYLDLRYRLMPYWYTLAHEASRTGYPIVRPLFWRSPDQKELWDTDDAFMLGDALLVAPIVEEGAQRRTVSLPPGRWYDMHDDRTFDSPKTSPAQVDLNAPLGRCPVLALAGSVLPTEEDGRLVLHVYAPSSTEEGAFQLYSDTGDGYGDWRLDRFTLSSEADGLVLRCDSEGEYPFPYTGVDFVTHGFVTHTATADGAKMELENGRFRLDVRDGFESICFIQADQ